MKFSMRIGKDRNGIYYLETLRNKRRSLGTRDEKIAKAILREAEKEALRGRLFDLEKAKRITLAEFKDEYIAYREGLKDLSSETIKKDKLSLKLLLDVSGNTLLVSADIEQFKNICLSRDASKITINGYLRHLKTALKWAVKKTYLKKLPEIVMYKKLKKLESELFEHILEPDEIKNFLRKAYKRSRDFGDYCLVSLWTGGRRRETLGIEYQKTDFKNETITLTGKTGTRTIPMLRPVKIVMSRDKQDIGRKFPDWIRPPWPHRRGPTAGGCWSILS